VLQCLCLGISCGFTTAYTFSLWQVEQAEVSGTLIFTLKYFLKTLYVCTVSSEKAFHQYLKKTFSKNSAETT
jgi:hypothetical protein